MYKRILSHPFIQDSFLLTTSGFIVSILNYLFNLLVARRYSLSDYGEYSSAISIITIATIPLGALALFIIKKMGQTPSGERKALIHRFEKTIYLLLLKYKITITLFLAIFIAFLYLTLQISTWSVLFIVSMLGLSLLQSIYQPASQALRLFWLLALLTISQTIVKLGSIFTISYFSNSFIFVYVILAITTAFMLYFNRKYLFINFNQKKDLTFPLPNIRSIFANKSIQLSILTTMGLISLSNIDVVLAKTYLSPQNVGLYGALSLISKIIFYAIGPLISIAYISFTNKEQSKQQHKILLTVLLGILIIGLTSIGFYNVFSIQVISLIFDTRYLEIAPYLWQAGLFGTLYACINLFAQYFLAQGSYKASLTICGVLFQIVLALFFHDSIAVFMKINLLVTLALTSIYLILWIYSVTKK